ncbi:RNA pseudouridine synthase 6, chloroplastic [Triticum aestivum]|uniref:RNA pseudouridine synthase 6, chloroplastic n=1 Tax=Triticum aestivum TaxID=4565 RepID=UPI001D0139C4|nr:RNA pseudouridine synthase 6, chloroplastic-like [Triticum aestivum]
MTKPAASLASLLPQLWHRPLPPPPLLPRALYSSSPLLTTHRRIPRHRFRVPPTTHLDAAAAARATRAADPVEALTATSYPAYDRLPPCPSKDDPPRMEHLVAREDEVAGDFISRSLNLPPMEK